MDRGSRARRDGAVLCLCTLAFGCSFPFAAGRFALLVGVCAPAAAAKSRPSQARRRSERMARN